MTSVSNGFTYRWEIYISRIINMNSQLIPILTRQLFINKDDRVMFILLSMCYLKQFRELYQQYDIGSWSYRSRCIPE